MATVTSVPLVSQYGTIEADSNGRVTAFREKPVLRNYWINAGFFVMDPEIFNLWQGENLEREVLPALQRNGRLFSYRHDGFFKSMDTHKDQQELEAIFDQGRTPWLMPVHGGVQGERASRGAARPILARATGLRDRRDGLPGLRMGRIASGAFVVGLIRDTQADLSRHRDRGLTSR